MVIFYRYRSDCRLTRTRQPRLHTRVRGACARRDSVLAAGQRATSMWTCVRPGLVGAAPRATPRRRPGTLSTKNHVARRRDRCARARSSPRDAETSLPSTSLWLATLRAAEGDDIAPAAALVAALEPGSDAARDALDESRSAEGGVSGTPLWLACLAARNGAPGAIELARAMVDKGADVTIPGTQGVAGDTTTPLWWASASVEAGAGADAADLAKRLIDAGADVDAEGTYDAVRGPPLLWAAVAVRNGEETNGLALAAVLLSAGADPNLRGSYGPTAVGVTPLVLAAQAAPENGGCVRLCASLLESGAAMDANEMSSLLMYRVGSSLVAVKNMLKGGRGD